MGWGTALLALGLGLALSGAGCGTIRMTEIALADDRGASVPSAWRTEEGGLALLLRGMETKWSEAEALLALSGEELALALAREGAAGSDVAALPVVLLPRARLVHGWSPFGADGPALTQDVAVAPIARRDWSAAVPAGTDNAGYGNALRIVYRDDYPAPDDAGERLLACMVIRAEQEGGEVRRAVFVVEGLDKGPLRVTALIGFGVLVDLAIVALLAI